MTTEQKIGFVLVVVALCACLWRMDTRLKKLEKNSLTWDLDEITNKVPEEEQA